MDPLDENEPPTPPPTDGDPYAHAPVFALWFSAKGHGPDPCILRLYPMVPMPSKHPELGLGHTLGINIWRTAEQEKFSFGYGKCPYGAGPMLSRDDVGKLHAMLGRWLDATAAPILPSDEPLDSKAYTDAGFRMRRIIAGTAPPPAVV